MKTLGSRLYAAGIKYLFLDGAMTLAGPHVKSVVVSSNAELEAFHVWAAENGATVEQASIGAWEDILHTQGFTQGSAH